MTELITIYEIISKFELQDMYVCMYAYVFVCICMYMDTCT